MCQICNTQGEMVDLFFLKITLNHNNFQIINLIIQDLKLKLLEVQHEIFVSQNKLHINSPLLVGLTLEHYCVLNKYYNFMIEHFSWLGLTLINSLSVLPILLINSGIAYQTMLFQLLNKATSQLQLKKNYRSIIKISS